MESIYFIRHADYGMHLAFMVVGTFTYLPQHLVQEKMLCQWPPVICQCSHRSHRSHPYLMFPTERIHVPRNELRDTVRVVGYLCRLIVVCQSFQRYFNWPWMHLRHSSVIYAHVQRTEIQSFAPSYSLQSNNQKNLHRMNVQLATFAIS